ncbi:hypothetical protein Ddc_04976 [Ditylenchus destructor]|nr:hypothetical protein Ddc_04976 [Ditylenchus destructor]
MTNKLFVALANKDLLLNWLDLALCILSGVNHALFTFTIGHYITIAVAYHPTVKDFPTNFPLIECVVQLMSVGMAVPILSFLLFVSLDDPSSLPEKMDQTTVLYKRKLAMFIRDLAFLASSVIIAFYCSWHLATPVMLMPVIALSWTTFFDRHKSVVYKGLLLAGPMCLVFLSMAFGGLYGTALVDMKVIHEPGNIFTVAAGIGASSLQFSNAKAQLWALTNPSAEPLSEVANVEDLRTNEIPAAAVSCDKMSDRETFIAFFRLIQLTITRRPFLYLVGLLSCILHSFGWPVFTKTTGIFFSVFEAVPDATNSTSAVDVYEFYSSKAIWVCLGYAVYGIVVFVSIFLTNVTFGKIGQSLVDEIREAGLVSNCSSSQNSINSIYSDDDLKELSNSIVLANCFVYGCLCMCLSITSALINNRWMGGLAVAVFSTQILVQFIISRLHHSSRYGQAIGFASTNGLQQLNQALCYAGGFILVQYDKAGSALNVFKIIQTMHLGSVGMTSNILLRKDFVKVAKSSRIARHKISPTKE